MKNEEWFSTWFDTEAYHTLYKNRDEIEADKFISNIYTHLNIESNSKILDLACGKGRHAKILNELGGDVLGADLSENSINSAKAMENERLNFLVHDMREKIEGSSFHYVFNLFTSFGYFDDVDDNIKMLNSIHSMLKENGTIVIDFLNANRVKSELVTEEQKTIDGVQFDITRKIENGFIYKNITVYREQIDHYQERVQLFGLDEFSSMLDKTGFKILRTFGSFNLDSFKEESSDRLIIVAQKL